MGIDMDHADGPLGGDGAEDRQCHQMIPTHGQRHCAGGMNLGEKRLDPPEAIQKIDGVDRGIAQIGDAAKPIRRDPADMVNLADEARHVAHFARAMAGTRPIGRAAVPGDADQGDIELRGIGNMGQTHEGGNRAKPGYQRCVDRLGIGIGHRGRFF
jgi:hypothetical protein